MAKNECITIDGRQVRIAGGDGGVLEGDVARLVEAVRYASVRGLEEQPNVRNLVWKVEAGPLVVCILEQEPALRRMEVITPDSPDPFGPTANYAPRRLATPYVILKVPFVRGMITSRCELFYRNEPLRHVDDPLYFSNLLNVSPHSHGCLAWLCTQYLHHERPKPGVTSGLDALVRHVWGAASNRSSEAHEGASCFSMAVDEGLDPRVTDFDRWEHESIKNPRFVLSVNWKPAGVTVRQLIEAELKAHRVPHNPTTAAEIINAFLASNGQAKKG